MVVVDALTPRSGLWVRGIDLGDPLHQIGVVGVIVEPREVAVVVFLAGVVHRVRAGAAVVAIDPRPTNGDAVNEAIPDRVRAALEAPTRFQHRRLVCHRSILTFPVADC